MAVGPPLAPRAISKFVIPLKVLSWIDGIFPKPRVDPVRRSGLDNAIIGLKIGQQ
ncbi:hypothetical protein HYPSUDRAFT_209088 [Hypholoma sublateritium FD-334 SS-4]|uniref:Uncharacterized protein n=1 Tax=Hypholoma sublateritium (strain FD-334 SS-4) TaxID=945553 RepID=A0A0D2N427_HYPSF|nr:hypothetical protein HYPSUDRAFT_209088 [Hypholoma sublateritium FD-334 SS-4]